MTGLRVVSRRAEQISGVERIVWRLRELIRRVVKRATAAKSPQPDGISEAYK